MILLSAILLSGKGSEKLFATLTRSRASLHTSRFFDLHSPRFLSTTVKEVNSAYWHLSDTSFLWPINFGIFFLIFCGRKPAKRMRFTQTLDYFSWGNQHTAKLWAHLSAKSWRCVPSQLTIWLLQSQEVGLIETSQTAKIPFHPLNCLNCPWSGVVHGVRYFFVTSHRQRGPRGDDWTSTMMNVYWKNPGWRCKESERI